METKGRICRALLTGAVCLYLLTGCDDLEEQKRENTETSVTLIFRHDKFASRAALPQEDKITDLSLMIFDSKGHIEECIYFDDAEDVSSCNVTLLKGARYDFCACANFGYRVEAERTEDLKGIEYHLAYPDEYREGVPMYAYLKDVPIEDNDMISITLERLMAKISLRIDRRRLSEDVRMTVRQVRIGNCPKKCKVFTNNSIASEEDCFAVGFTHKDLECTALNSNIYGGISEEISLYMLENMQGRFSEEPLHTDSEKVMADSDPRKQTCSYVMIEADYLSDTWQSGAEPLIYRFYLGEDRNSLDVERNCHYRITICPDDDGLSEDSWRVDKSGLEMSGEPSLSAYPSSYIRGNVGDEIHIGCKLSPEDAPFDVGEEYMIADKERGIYDYEIDEDGHGAELRLTGPGTGLIYMSAGSPIDDSALFVIEVNLDNDHK